MPQPDQTDIALEVSNYSYLLYREGSAGLTPNDFQKNLEKQFGEPLTNENLTYLNSQLEAVDAKFGTLEFKETKPATTLTEEDIGKLEEKLHENKVIESFDKWAVSNESADWSMMDNRTVTELWGKVHKMAHEQAKEDKKARPEMTDQEQLQRGNEHFLALTNTLMRYQTHIALRYDFPGSLQAPAPLVFEDPTKIRINRNTILEDVKRIQEDPRLLTQFDDFNEQFQVATGINAPWPIGEEKLKLPEFGGIYYQITPHDPSNLKPKDELTEAQEINELAKLYEGMRMGEAYKETVNKLRKKMSHKLPLADEIPSEHLELYGKTLQELQDSINIRDGYARDWFVQTQIFADGEYLEPEVRETYRDAADKILSQLMKEQAKASAYTETLQRITGKDLGQVFGSSDLIEEFYGQIKDPMFALDKMAEPKRIIYGTKLPVALNPDGRLATAIQAGRMDSREARYYQSMEGLRRVLEAEEQVLNQYPDAKLEYESILENAGVVAKPGFTDTFFSVTKSQRQRTLEEAIQAMQSRKTRLQQEMTGLYSQGVVTALTPDPQIVEDVDPREQVAKWEGAKLLRIGEIEIPFTEEYQKAQEQYFAIASGGGENQKLTQLASLEDELNQLNQKIKEAEASEGWASGGTVSAVTSLIDFREEVSEATSILPIQAQVLSTAMAELLEVTLLGQPGSALFGVDDEALQKEIEKELQYKRMSGQSTDKEETTLDPMRVAIMNATDIEELRERPDFNNIPIKSLPFAIRERLKVSKFGDPFSKEEIMEMRVENLFPGLPVAPEEAAIQHNLTLDMLQEHVRMRDLETAGYIKAAENIMGGWVNSPTFDPYSNTVSYTPSKTGMFMGTWAAAAPRIVMESRLAPASPALIDYALQSRVGKSLGVKEYTPLRDFENTGVISRVLANLSFGDPGAMGSYASLARGLGYTSSDTEYQFAKYFGMGADFLVPWEPYIAKGAALPFRAAGRGITATRRARKMRLPVRKVIATELSGDWTLNLGAAVWFAPAMFYTRADTPYLNWTFASPLQRFAGDERFRQNVANGVTTSVDHVARATYRNNLEQIEKGENPAKPPEYQYGKDELERLKTHQAFVDNAIRLISDLDGIEDLASRIDAENSQNMPKIRALATKMLAKEMDTPDLLKPLATKTSGHAFYKFLNKLDNLEKKGNISETEKALIRSLFETTAEFVYPDNPGKYFEVIQFHQNQKLRKPSASDYPDLPVSDIVRQSLDRSHATSALRESVEVYDNFIEDLGNYPAVENRIQVSGSKALANTTVGHIDDIPVDASLVKSVPVEYTKQVSKGASARIILSPRLMMINAPTDDIFFQGRKLQSRGKQKRAERAYKTTAMEIESSNLDPAQKQALKARLNPEPNAKNISELTDSEIESFGKKRTDIDEYSKFNPDARLIELQEEIAQKTHEKSFDNLAVKEKAEVEIEAKKKLAEQLDELIEKTGIEVHSIRTFLTKSGKGGSNNEAIIQFFLKNIDGKTYMVVRDMSGRWMLNWDDIGEVALEVQAHRDLYWRKMAVYSVMNHAARKGYAGVYLPRGEDGIFRQLWKKEDRIDYVESPEGDISWPPKSGLDEALEESSKTYMSDYNGADNVKVVELEGTGKSYTHIPVTEELYNVVENLEKPKGQVKKNVVALDEEAPSSDLEIAPPSPAELPGLMKERLVRVLHVRHGEMQKIAKAGDPELVKEYTSKLQTAIQELAALREAIESGEKIDLAKPVRLYRTENNQLAVDVRYGGDQSDVARFTGRLVNDDKAAAQRQLDPTPRKAFLLEELEADTSVFGRSSMADQESIQHLLKEHEGFERIIKDKKYEGTPQLKEAKEMLPVIREIIVRSGYDMKGNPSDAAMLTSAYSDVTGIPRRAVRQLLASLTNSGIDAVGWSQTNQLVGAAILQELRDTGVPHRVRLSGLRSSPELYTYVEIGSPAKPVMQGFDEFPGQEAIPNRYLSTVYDPQVVEGIEFQAFEAEPTSSGTIDLRRGSRHVQKKLKNVLRWINPSLAATKVGKEIPKPTPNQLLSEARRISPKIEQSFHREYGGLSFDDISALVKDTENHVNQTKIVRKKDGTISSDKSGGWVKQELKQAKSRLENLEPESDKYAEAQKFNEQRIEFLKARQTEAQSMLEALKEMKTALGSAFGKLERNRFWFGDYRLLRDQQNTILRMYIYVDDLIEGDPAAYQDLVRIEGQWHVPVDVIVSEANTKAKKLNTLMVHAMGTVSKENEGLMSSISTAVLTRLTKIATEEGYDSIGLRLAQKDELTGLYQQYLMSMETIADAWGLPDTDRFFDYVRQSKENLAKLTPAKANDRIERLAAGERVASGYVQRSKADLQADAKLYLNELQDTDALTTEIASINRELDNIEANRKADQAQANSSKDWSEYRKKYGHGRGKERVEPKEGTPGAKVKELRLKRTGLQKELSVMKEHNLNLLAEDHRFRSLSHAVGANVLRFDNSLHDTLHVMMISDEMRDTVPSRSRKTLLRSESREFRTEPETNMLTDFMPDETGINARHIMAALQKENDGVHVSNALADYILTFKKKPEESKFDKIEIALMEVDDQVQVRDPETLIDSPLLTELRNTVGAEATTTYVQHLQNHGVLKQYEARLKELGYEVDVQVRGEGDIDITGIPDTELLASLQAKERSITRSAQGIPERIGAKSAGIDEAIGSTKTAGGFTLFTDYNPTRRASTGLSEFDVYALENGIGLDELVKDMYARLDEILGPRLAILGGGISLIDLARVDILNKPFMDTKVLLSDLLANDKIKRFISVFDTDVALQSGRVITPTGEVKLNDFLRVYFETRRGKAALRSIDQPGDVLLKTDLHDIAELFGVSAENMHIPDQKGLKALRAKIRKNPQENVGFIREYLGISHEKADGLLRRPKDVEFSPHLVEDLKQDNILSPSMKGHQMVAAAMSSDVSSSELVRILHMAKSKSGLRNLYNMLDTMEFSTPELIHIAAHLRSGRYDMLANVDVVLERVRSKLNLDEIKQADQYGEIIRLTEAKKLVFKPEPEDLAKVDYLAELTADEDLLRIKIPRDVSVRGFLIANSHIIERLISAEDYQHLTRNYDSVRSKSGRSRLTAKGASRMASDIGDYIQTGKRTVRFLRPTILTVSQKLSRFFLRGVGRSERQAVDSILPQTALPPKMLDFWYGVFNPGQKAYNEASKIIGLGRSDLEPLTIKVSSLAEERLEQQRLRSISGKTEAERMQMSAEELLQELGNKNFDPINNDIQRVGDNLYYTPRGVVAGDTMSAKELFSRLWAIAEVDHLRKTTTAGSFLSRNGEQIVPMTTRTIVVESKVAAINQAVKSSIESALRRSIDDIQDNFRVVEKVDADTGHSYKESQIMLSIPEAEAIVALATKVAAEPMGDIIARNLTSVDILKDRAQNQLTYVTTEEWNSLNEALVDTNAGIGARRSRAAEAVPESLVESVIDMFAKIPEKLAKRGISRHPLQFKNMLTEKLVTSQPGEEMLNPGMTELLTQFSRETNNVTEDLIRIGREIKKQLDTTEAVDTATIYMVLEKLKDILVPVVRTTYLPDLLHIYKRAQMGEVTSSETFRGIKRTEPFTADDMVNGGLLNRIEAVLDEGQGMYKDEAMALSDLRQLKNTEELTPVEQLKVSAAFHTLMNGIEYRHTQFAMAADVVIKSLTGFELPANIMIPELARIRSRAYTLFYDGRWLPTERGGIKDYTKANAPKGGWTVQSAIDVFRNQGFGGTNLSDAYVVELVDRAFKEEGFSGKKLSQLQRADKANKGVKQDDILTLLNFGSKQYSGAVSGDLMGLAEELGASTPFSQAGLAVKVTDPVAQIAEMLVRLRGFDLQKKLARDVIKMGYGVDLYAEASKLKNYGLNPLEHRKQFIDNVEVYVQQILDYRTVTQTDEKGQLYNPSTLPPEFAEIKMNNLEQEPQTLVEYQAYQTAHIILEKLGISRRGIMNRDSLVKYQMADGRTIMLPETAVTAANDLLDRTLSVGKAVGAGTVEDTAHFLTEAQKDLATRGRSWIVDDDAPAIISGLKESANWYETKKQQAKSGLVAHEQLLVAEGLATWKARAWGLAPVAAAGVTVMALGANMTGLAGATIAGMAAYIAYKKHLITLGAERTQKQTALLEGYEKLALEAIKKAATEADAVDPTQLLKMVESEVQTRTAAKQKLLAKVTRTKRERLQKQLDKKGDLKSFNRIMGVESAEEWMLASPDKIRRGLKKLNTERGSSHRIVETTAKDYLKAVSGGKINLIMDNVLRFLLSPSNIVYNVHAMFKMHVTVGGPALPTMAYFNGNFMGGAMQEYLGFGLTRHLVGMAVGSFAGAAAGAAVGSIAGGMLGALGGAAIGGAFSRKLPRNWAQFTKGPTGPARGRQIPAVMNLLFQPRGLVQEKIDSGLKRMIGTSVAPIVTPSGKIYSMIDIANDMKRYGAGTSFLKEETSALFAREFRDAFNRGTLNELGYYGSGKGFLELWVELAESTDNFYRVGSYMDLLEQGRSPQAAAKEVRRVFFDYADMTKFEKEVLRNIFLFYSFMKKNSQLIFETLCRKPERLLGFQRLREDLQRDAYDSVLPELATNEFYASRFPFPWWGMNFGLSGGKGTPTQFSGVYERMVPISPPVNDTDALTLWFDIYDMLTNPLPDEATRGIMGSTSPILKAPIVAISGKEIFSGGRIENQMISPHLIHIDQQMGGIVFGRGPGDETAWIKTKMKFPTEKGFEGGDTSRYNIETTATYLAKKMGHPHQGSEGGGMIMPASKDDAMKWWMVQNGGGVALLSQMPYFRHATMLLGRPGKQVDNWDRGDLASWSLDRLGAQALLDYSTGLDTSKLSDEEVRALFWKDLKMDPDQATVMFDHLWKPPGIPPEYYFGNILGFRYTFIRTHRQQAQSVLNDIEFDTKKK